MSEGTYVIKELICCETGKYVTGGCFHDHCKGPKRVKKKGAKDVHTNKA